MMEMLGVLAIIGVLSIGGFYGYKHAMIRYKAGQYANMVNRAAFTFKELCPQGETCPFKGASGTGETYTYNRNILCAHAGSDFCVNTPYFNSGRPTNSYWYFYTFDPGNGRAAADFGLYNVSPQFCSYLLDMPFDGLSRVMVYASDNTATLKKTLARHAVNGRMTDTDRQDLKEICTYAASIDGMNTIYFGFSQI